MLTGDFTVEGYVMVGVGDGGKYMFSYEARGAGGWNCLLVRANVLTFGVWVHWAMTVTGSSHTVQHYLNGVASTAPR